MTLYCNSRINKFTLHFAHIYTENQAKEWSSTNPPRIMLGFNCQIFPLSVYGSLIL